jgi:hypothetical protein
MEHISLELIAYQNKDPVVPKLIDAVESIYKEIDNKVYQDNGSLLQKSTYVKDIETHIRERFNLNLVIDHKLYVLSPMAIIPFFGDYLRDYSAVKNFGSDFFAKIFSGNTGVYTAFKNIEKDRKKIFNKISNKKGYIDLKRAKVGGYLSETKHFLIMDLFTMKEAFKLTPEELVATILHEVGHAFTGLEYHFKLEKTNVVILDILDNINNKNHDKALYIFKKHFDDKDIQELSLDKTSARYDFYGKLALKYIEVIKTQMVNNKYDETTFEVLSDSFSARFGLYKPLVSGLNKIYKSSRQAIDINSSFTFMEVYGSLIMLLLLALFPPFGIFIFILILFVIFGDSTPEMTYDFPKERMQRIGYQLVNNLKSQNLPEEIEKDLIEQYVFINEIVQKTKNFEAALDKMLDYISFSERDNKYYIQLQQSIEKHLNNVLFVKSKQLKHI